MNNLRFPGTWLSMAVVLKKNLTLAFSSYVYHSWNLEVIKPVLPITFGSRFERSSSLLIRSKYRNVL